MHHLLWRCQVYDALNISLSPDYVSKQLLTIRCVPSNLLLMGYAAAVDNLCVLCPQLCNSHTARWLRMLESCAKLLQSLQSLQAYMIRPQAAFGIEAPVAMPQRRALPIFTTHDHDAYRSRGDIQFSGGDSAVCEAWCAVGCCLCAISAQYR